MERVPVCGEVSGVATICELHATYSRPRGRQLYSQVSQSNYTRPANLHGCDATQNLHAHPRAYDHHRAQLGGDVQPTVDGKSGKEDGPPRSDAGQSTTPVRCPYPPAVLLSLLPLITRHTRQCPWRARRATPESTSFATSAHEESKSATTQGAACAATSVSKLPWWSVQKHGRPGVSQRRAIDVKKKAMSASTQ